jgi:predicted nucleic acid-binding protein
MLVVTDTTPINYLVLIGYIDILPSLYSHVARFAQIWR